MALTSTDHRLHIGKVVNRTLIKESNSEQCQLRLGLKNEADFVALN